MNKKILVSLVVQFSLFSILAQNSTYDYNGQRFVYEYEGQSINYTIIDAKAKTCRVTSGSDFRPGNPEKSGKLILPDHPQFDVVKYTLKEIGNYAFSE